MQVDAGYLNALPGNDITMIKRSFAGSIGANGAIAAYTIKGEEWEEE
jgi:hypothetical protein